ncbi:MAG: hypothetical protein ACD_37C00207G0004, partial [uncultured bacterium]
MKILNYFLILSIFSISFLIFQKGIYVVAQTPTPTEIPAVSAT